MTSKLLKLLKTVGKDQKAGENIENIVMWLERLCISAIEIGIGLNESLTEIFDFENYPKYIMDDVDEVELSLSMTKIMTSVIAIEALVQKIHLNPEDIFTACCDDFKSKEEYFESLSDSERMIFFMSSLSF